MVIQPGRQGEARYPYVPGNDGCGEHQWRESWRTRTWRALKTKIINGFTELKKLAKEMR